APPEAAPTVANGTGGKAPTSKAVASMAPSALHPGGAAAVGHGGDPARIGPAPARPPGPIGKTDTFDDAGGPPHALTHADARNAYAPKEGGLKAGYDRPLKADPTSTVTKMVVKITISSRGSISEISVPEKSDLGACVANSIRNWRFRRSNGDFRTEFTV